MGALLLPAPGAGQAVSGVPAALRKLARYYGNGGLTTYEFKRFNQHVNDVRDVLTFGGKLHEDDEVWVTGACSEEKNMKQCSEACEAVILSKFRGTATREVLSGLILYPEMCQDVFDFPPFMKLSHAGTTIATGPAALAGTSMPQYRISRGKRAAHGAGGPAGEDRLFLDMGGAALFFFVFIMLAVAGAAICAWQPVGSMISASLGRSRAPREERPPSRGRHGLPTSSSSGSLRRAGMTVIGGVNYDEGVAARRRVGSENSLRRFGK